MKMNIYGFGNALIDLEFKVSEEDILEIGIPKGSMKHLNGDERDHFLKRFRGNHSNTSAGGSIANSLDAASSHNALCHFSCSLGSDERAQDFLEEFKSVETSFKVSDKPTGICFIFITPDGERTMAASLDANYDLSPECLNVTALRKSDVLVFDSFSITTENGFQTVQAAMEEIKGTATELVYGLADSSLIKSNIDKISWLIDNNLNCIVGNQNEIDELKKLTSLDSVNILTTKGPLGASFNKLNLPAQKVLSINTNGAGDALLGVYLARKSEDGIEIALQKAIAYASKTCTTKGPRIKNAT